MGTALPHIYKEENQEATTVEAARSMKEKESQRGRNEVTLAAAG